jgi:hypothetical protein
MRYIILISIFLVMISFGSTLRANPIVRDFEGFPDSTILTNQYSGLIFSNAIILTAGIVV